MRSQRIKTSFRIARFRLIRSQNNLECAVNESYLKLLRLVRLSCDVLFTSCTWRALRHDSAITMYFAAVTTEHVSVHDIHAFRLATLNDSRIHPGEKAARGAPTVQAVSGFRFTI
jgi:hypothetical protein